MIVGAAVLVIALVAWGIWAMTHDSAGGGSGRRGVTAESAAIDPAAGAQGRSLAADLDGWVAAGLISREQADAIAAHERAAAAARKPTRERRVSLIAEALGYVGTALALAGAGVGLGQAWEDIAGWGRLSIAGGATALLLLGGFVLLSQTEPAFRRLQSVLWFLAVGAAVWALVVLGVEFLDLEDDERILLLIGAGTAALAAVLWAVRREALQHAALFASRARRSHRRGAVPARRRPHVGVCPPRVGHWGRLGAARLVPGARARRGWGWLSAPPGR